MLVAPHRRMQHYTHSPIVGRGDGVLMGSLLCRNHQQCEII